MAVIRVERIFAKSPATISADGKNTYTEIYTVETDDKDDGPLTVATATGLPSLRSTYATPNEFDLSARLRQIVPERKGPTLWELTLSYDTDVEEEDNPLERPPKWSMSFATYTRIAEKDIDGNPIMNSARMAYNPPVEIDDNRPIVRVVRNEARFDIDRARKFKDCVNSKTWKGQPPRTVKCRPFPSGDEQEENGIKFYSVTYEFELADEGQTWEYEILDAGFYWLFESVDGEDSFPLVLLDENGNPYQEPVKLDGNGRQLTNGAEPVYKKWRLLREQDLNLLGL